MIDSTTIYSVSKKTRLKLSCNQLSLNRLASSILSILIGGVAVGCTQSAVVSPSNSAVVSPAAVDVVVQQTSDPASKDSFEESALSGIEKHMAYGEARAALIANGWTPEITTTVNSDEFHTDLAIRDLVERGFTEVTACSGTGLGYCAFAFTYTGQAYPEQRGRTIGLTTVSSERAANGEPTLWEWGISDPEDETVLVDSVPGTVDSSDQVNNTYADQPFSSAIFGPYVRQSEGFCAGLPDACSYSEYAFSDLKLIAAPNDIGGTVITLLPRGLITERDAQEYVAILDVFSHIDFAQPSEDRFDLDQQLIKRYHGCPKEGEMGLAPSCFADITITNMGSVSEIRYIQTLGAH
ncbi:MAG: hypothetical protein ACFB16_02955 [Phormidesmis sp.]